MIQNGRLGNGTSRNYNKLILVSYEKRQVWNGSNVIFKPNLALDKLSHAIG